MKYRLKVRMSKRIWKLGIVVYNTIEEARMRQAEMKLVGIDSIIVNELGDKI